MNLYPFPNKLQHCALLLDVSHDTHDEEWAIEGPTIDKTTVQF